VILDFLGHTDFHGKTPEQFDMPILEGDSRYFLPYFDD
jgi:hypothetical protein